MTRRQSHHNQIFSRQQRFESFLTPEPQILKIEEKMSLAEFYIYHGIDPYGGYNDSDEWDEYQQFDDSDDPEEEIELDPIQEQLEVLKIKHEKALNEDNLAYQEVRDAWDVKAFRDAKLGPKEGKMNAAQMRKGMTKTAATRAENEVLEFATSQNIELSSDEKLLKEMRRNMSALDGAWNLHRVSMKNSRGMSEDTISKIMEMKEKGAQYLNFQFLIGPGGSGSMQFEGENWTLYFDVQRSCGVGEDGIAGLDMDTISFALFNNWSSLISKPDFEMFIINSNDEIVENAKICGNVYLDRTNASDQENLEDISYRVVINVFPEIEDE